MLQIVGIALVVVIIAFLAYVASRPNDFRVHRTTTVNAPPDQIFPLINDFHQWEAWSPFDKRDPAMRRTYSGAAAGTGAVYEWLGNSQVGTGRMEIRETTPPEKVVIDLHFIKPFEGRNVAEFTMIRRDGATEVTWGMYGPLAFVPKAMGVFMPMDRMIGKDFDAGLANLKAVAER
jgi:uncharacterized protein YndB with AHSA1/START domain